MKEKELLKQQQIVQEDTNLEYGRAGYGRGYYGNAARALQEADNVMTIVRKRDYDGQTRKYLHVSSLFRLSKQALSFFSQINKNRYLGNRLDSDVLELRFDRNTLCHTIRDLRPLRMRGLYVD